MMSLYSNSKDDVAAVDVNMGCPKEFSIKVISFRTVVRLLHWMYRVEWEQLC